MHLGRHPRRAEPRKKAQSDKRRVQTQAEGAEHRRVVEKCRRVREGRAGAGARGEADDAEHVRPRAGDELDAAADR